MESKVRCVDGDIASLGVFLIISLGGVLHEVWKAGGGGICRDEGAGLAMR